MHAGVNNEKMKFVQRVTEIEENPVSSVRVTGQVGVGPEGEGIIKQTTEIRPVIFPLVWKGQVVVVENKM